MTLIKTAIAAIASGVAALAVAPVSPSALADVTPVAAVAVNTPISPAARPLLSQDFGCDDSLQEGKDGKMHSACTAGEDLTPAQRKDGRDCIVNGGGAAVVASPGGPVTAGGAGVVACATAIYNNHSH